MELAIKEHPDVVLADFLMPGMNGLDLLHRLRSSPVTWDIPVILMSGFGADETLLKVLVTAGEAATGGEMAALVMAVGPG